MRIGGLTHHSQYLPDTLLRDKVEEGRLFELDGQSLTERAVEDRIASGVGEVREDEQIFVGERFGLSAMLPEEDACSREDPPCPPNPRRKRKRKTSINATTTPVDSPNPDRIATTVKRDPSSCWPPLRITHL